MVNVHKDRSMLSWVQAWDLSNCTDIGSIASQRAMMRRA
jgi:hypothetical protein